MALKFGSREVDNSIEYDLNSGGIGYSVSDKINPHERQRRPERIEALTFLHDNEEFSSRVLSRMGNSQRLSGRAIALLLGIVSCSLSLVFTTPEAAFAAPPKKRKVAQIRVGTAHLRDKPGESAKSKALLDHGDKARVVSRKGEWLKVRTEAGREGWVREDLVKQTKATFHDKSEETEKHSSPRRSRSAKLHTTSRVVSHKTRKSPAKTTTKVAAKPDGPSPAAIAAARKPFLRDSNLRKPVVTTVAANAAVPKPTTKAVVTIPSSGSSTAVESPETSIAINVPEPISPEAIDPAETTDTTEAIPDAQDSAQESKTDSSTLSTESRDANVVRGALSYRGTRYRMGATGRGAFDCSAFVRHVFAKEGKDLPRTAAEQFQCGRMVDKSELRPGDIVFFKNTYKRGISHVGIYIGNGRFIHASSASGAVTTSALSDGYYVNHWAGAKRLD